MNREATLGFYGGVGSVTGANFLFDTGASKILVDCGLIQGNEFAMRENAKDFAYDPKSIEHLFVTHAHADHIGRIPKLVKDGFNGIIHSTSATFDLTSVMLRDAYKVMSYEAARYDTKPIYEPEDIDRALSLWETHGYGDAIDLPGEVTAVFTNAGHILGSAFVTFRRGERAVFFSGDVGNVPQPLLDAPDIPTDIDYMLIESVYGDRLHEEVEERSELLLNTIRDTIAENGTLIIPAFSLERTQAMLFEINNFVESGLIEPVPTFLDSPLAISVTEIYRHHTKYLKNSVREQIHGGDDIFDFPKLAFTETKQESKDIWRTPGPKIIIAGSGMSHGGRILEHERKYLEDPNTILLLVGYQGVGSLGRLLQDGAKKVRIYDTEVRVKAQIRTIRGYSGHADRDGLMNVVEKSADTLKGVYVAMGEERSSLFLVQRLRDYLGVNAIAPKEGDMIKIDF